MSRRRQFQSAMFVMCCLYDVGCAGAASCVDDTAWSFAMPRGHITCSNYSANSSSRRSCYRDHHEHPNMFFDASTELFHNTHGLESAAPGAARRATTSAARISSYALKVLRLWLLKRRTWACALSLQVILSRRFASSSCTIGRGKNKHRYGKVCITDGSGLQQTTGDFATGTKHREGKCKHWNNSCAGCSYRIAGDNYRIAREQHTPYVETKMSELQKQVDESHDK